jgi:hypothetical protein
MPRLLRCFSPRRYGASAGCASTRAPDARNRSAFPAWSGRWCVTSTPSTSASDRSTRLRAEVKAAQSAGSRRPRESAGRHPRAGTSSYRHPRAGRRRMRRGSCESPSRRYPKLIVAQARPQARQDERPGLRAYPTRCASGTPRTACWREGGLRFDRDAMEGRNPRGASPSVATAMRLGNTKFACRR